MKLKVKQQDMWLFLLIFGVSLYYVLKNSSIYVEQFKLILLSGDMAGLAYIAGKKWYAKKVLLMYASFLVISVFYFLLLNNYSILTIFVFMIVCVEEDIDKVINQLFYSNVFLLLLFFILGIGAEDNMLALQMSSLLLLYICKKRAKLSLFSLLFLILMGFPLAGVLNSGSMGVILFIAIVLIVLRKFRFGTRILKNKVIAFVFPICFLLNFFFAECVGKLKVPLIGNILPFSWNNAIISLSMLLDSAMSYRLSLTSKSLEYFGFSLWGGDIDLESLKLNQYTYFYLDSGYANLLQDWGIIFSILFLSFLTIIMFYFMKQERYDLIISGICIALWALNEPVLNIVPWNFIIIFGGQGVVAVIFKKKTVHSAVHQIDAGRSEEGQI